MITIAIPGAEKLELKHLVLDFNGTIAAGGRLIEGAAERIRELSRELSVFVITADTNGSVLAECADLPIGIHVIGREDQAGEKQRFVESLGLGAVAIGNGRNDAKMFTEAALSIAVIGDEGCCTQTLLSSDIAVRHILDAFDLLLKPNRLVATLRT